MKVIHSILMVMTCSQLLLWSGCEQVSTGPSGNNHQDTTHVVVRKPNIYIYPENRTDVSVSLAFTNGGKIIESIPLYENGWEVSVDTNGIIDQQYGYLYYECELSNVFQNKSGWIVSGAEINAFFEENLYAYGFRGREIDDFIDYWVPKLNESRRYVIFPQLAELIDKYIQLNIYPNPQSVIRLFYVIEDYDDDKRVIHEPVIRQFLRRGFTVVEWGVIR